MVESNLTAWSDRDDPFEMVLKTCHHLRAEGMSRSTLQCVESLIGNGDDSCCRVCICGKIQAELSTKLVYVLRKSPGLVVNMLMRRCGMHVLWKYSVYN